MRKENRAKRTANPTDTRFKRTIAASIIVIVFILASSISQAFATTVQFGVPYPYGTSGKSSSGNCSTLVASASQSTGNVNVAIYCGDPGLLQTSHADAFGVLGDATGLTNPPYGHQQFYTQGQGVSFGAQVYYNGYMDSANTGQAQLTVSIQVQYASCTPSGCSWQLWQNIQVDSYSVFAGSSHYFNSQTKTYTTPVFYVQQTGYYRMQLTIDGQVTVTHPSGSAGGWAQIMLGQNSGCSNCIMTVNWLEYM